MAGKGGGAWKVAYADFVTAMMAFFMVMWITAQNQQVKEAIAHHFSDPFGARDRNGKSGGVSTSGAPFTLKENTRFSIRPKIKTDTHNGREYQSGMVIYFAGTSTEMDGYTTTSLESLLPEMKWNARQIDIIGYTNPELDRNQGIDPWELAHKRCHFVRKFLEDRGVSTGKIKVSQTVTSPDLLVENQDSEEDEDSKGSELDPVDRVEIRLPPPKSNQERENADRS